MSINNDSKILILRQQIQEKKNKLDETKRFLPITNCSIEVDGVRNNINVLSKEQLISLMVKLNTYKLSAKDLGILDEYFISGYLVGDWITDIKAKLDVLSRKDEERKLKIMEDRLTELLSNEKKVELELGEIENLLK